MGQRIIDLNLLFVKIIPRKKKAHQNIKNKKERKTKEEGPKKVEKDEIFNYDGKKERTNATL